MTNIEFAFTQDRETAKRLVAHLKPIPRSVVRQNEVQLLDGVWEFALDLDDQGLDQEWYRRHSFTDRAHWPGSIEEAIEHARSAKNDDSSTCEEVVAWYQRSFTIPAAWYEMDNALIQVTFGACGYETRVWLNGHSLETIEGEVVHFGEYSSFSYELPPELLQAENRLTVRIADSLDAEVPRGKQESRVFKRGGIWYQTITGPVRSVWLEPVERNRLRSRLGVIASIEDHLVEFVLTTRIHDPGQYQLRLVVADRAADHVVAVDEFALNIHEAGQKAQRVVMKLPEAKLWSPSSPHLYHLTAQLTTPTGDVSRIESHFGLRRIEARGHFIYLNGERIYLDGILYQPGTSTVEEIVRHLAAMKSLGCNLVHVHIAGIDPRIYDLADEMGMLLWFEVPSPHRSTERSRELHRQELRRMAMIAASHPACVICSLYNEDWGAEDIAENPVTRAYIADMFAHLRLAYPQFLVVDNDGWQHVSTEGRLESHLMTAHLYTPELAKWRAMLTKLMLGVLEGVAAKPLVVGDPFFFRGQVPIVVSEWGGFGFPDYGGPADANAKTTRIRAFKRELRRRLFAGDVYTQATNIEDEVNGLIDARTGQLQVPPGILLSAHDHEHPGAAELRTDDLSSSEI